MRWGMVRLGVPLSTAAATRAIVSPGDQRQPSACAHTSEKFSARLANPGRHSSEWAVCMVVPSVGTSRIDGVDIARIRDKVSPSGP